MFLFMDGMAHYATAHLGRKWTSVATATGVTWSIAAEGRTGNCIKRVSTSSECTGISVSPLITQAGSWTPTTSGVCGFALKITDLSKLSSTHAGTWNNSPAPNSILTVIETGLPLLTFAVASDGTFYIESMPPSSFGSFVLRATSIEGLLADTWMYVECKWNIANPGYAQVRINGVTVLNFTGNLTPDLTFTGHTWGGTWNTVKMLGTIGHVDGVTMRMCDFYLCDLEGSGDQLRDYAGDITIDYIKPDGVGATSGWTPSSGANWTTVDEVPPDEADYVSTTAVATKDTYTFTNVPSGFTPIVFQSCIYAKKETAGAAMIRPVMRHASTDYNGPAQGVASDTDYYYVLTPYDTNPGTSARATEADINAAQFGEYKAT